MDSKSKFIKNKLWRKKYQRRNAASIAKSISKNPKHKHEEKSNHLEEESEDEYVLKQSVPEDGWFPEDDSWSSSDFEDLKQLTINAKPFELPSSEDYYDDKNWFDKELDNVQLKSEVSASEKNKNVEENKLQSISQETDKNEYQACDSKVQNILKKGKDEEKNSVNDIENDEKELDFLLSLKDPVHTAPVIMKNSIKNDRRLNVSTHNCTEQKSTKPIDLEKWLDSVLDD